MFQKLYGIAGTRAKILIVQLIYYCFYPNIDNTASDMFVGNNKVSTPTYLSVGIGVKTKSA